MTKTLECGCEFDYSNDYKGPFVVWTYPKFTMKFSLAKVIIRACSNHTSYWRQ